MNSLGLVESPTSTPNPLAAAWGSGYFPGPQAVANSVPGWTGGVLPAPVIDPATGFPVVPSIPGLPGGTVVTTPGGTPAVVAPPGVVVPGVQNPSFWDKNGPAIAAGLAVVGALSLAGLAYTKFRGY